MPELSAGSTASTPAARQIWRKDLRSAGAIAVLLAAAMTLQASPAWASDPGPSNALPGQGTATPVLVEDIREPVDAKAAPADAARQHLAANKSRYKIPGRAATSSP